MWRYFRFAVIAVWLVAGPAESRPAQSDVEPGLAQIPFDRWLAAGERQQIPWQVTLRKPWMRADLRLAAGFTVSVSARELSRRGPEHELFLLARVADSAGQWIPSHGLLRHKIDANRPAGENVSFSINFLVKPGDLKLALVLYDRATGERNFALHPLHIAALENDPLPQAFRDLPPAEFTPPAENLDRFLEPQVRSRLWLPVQSAEPVEVQVLMNFALPAPAYSPRDDSRRRWILARTVKLFSQLLVENGTLQITGIDTHSRQLLFVLDDTRNIAWNEIRESLARIQPGTVSVEALESGSQGALFLRDTVLNLLAQQASDSDAPPSSRRILIVVSNPIDFARLGRDNRLPRAENCNCRVFYFSYRFVESFTDDKITDALARLRPRRFDLYRPEDVRKALAAVLKEIAGS